MEDKKDKLEWWGKTEQDLKTTPASRGRSTAAETPKATAAESEPTKRRRRVSTSGKQQKSERVVKGERGERGEKLPLSKMALFLRTIKHSIYMLLIVVCGAIGAHYLLTSITRHGAGCTVPQLETLTIPEAERVVAADGLQLIINDSLYAPAYRAGAILDQLPKAGVVVKPGRAIYLTVNASQRRVVDVPYVAERSLRQAKNMLALAGLSIGELIYVDDLARNYVLSQSIDGKQIEADSKERATIGSEVNLTIGRGGDDKTTVPQLLGLTLRDAKTMLCDAGLNVGEVKFDSDVDPVMNMQARIYAQSIDSDSEGRFGEHISLELSSIQSKVDSMILVQYRLVKEMEMMIELETMLDDAAYMDVNGELFWEDPETKEIESMDEIYKVENEL